MFIQNTSVTLNIWDTAGQERFHALGPIYYRESNGALLVYDVTDPDSFSKVKVWVKELRKILQNNVCLTIVGNKVDLLSRDERQNLSNDLINEAKSYAQSAQATHFVTSAKTNFGIDELFLDLTKRKSFSPEYFPSFSNISHSLSRHVTASANSQPIIQRSIIIIARSQVSCSVYNIVNSLSKYFYPTEEYLLLMTIPTMKDKIFVMAPNEDAAELGAIP